MKESNSSGTTGMKRIYVRTIGVILAVFLVVGLGFLASCSSSDPQALYENKCGSCHDLSVVEEAQYASSEWADVIKDMQSKTTTISDEDAQKITEYLENK